MVSVLLRYWLHLPSLCTWRSLCFSCFWGLCVPFLLGVSPSFAESPIFTQEEQAFIKQGAEYPF